MEPAFERLWADLPRFLRLEPLTREILSSGDDGLCIRLESTAGLHQVGMAAGALAVLAAAAGMSCRVCEQSGAALILEFRAA